jgi:hypothetical protein
MMFVGVISPARFCDRPDAPAIAKLTNASGKSRKRRGQRGNLVTFIATTGGQEPKSYDARQLLRA